jgi:hypothetical protein
MINLMNLWVGMGMIPENYRAVITPSMAAHIFQP